MNIRTRFDANKRILILKISNIVICEIKPNCVVFLENIGQKNYTQFYFRWCMIKFEKKFLKKSKLLK